jgi:hypothetical protein
MQRYVNVAAKNFAFIASVYGYLFNQTLLKSPKINLPNWAQNVFNRVCTWP